LQNAEPIDIATLSYELPGTLETTTEAGVGQWCERYLAVPTVMMRG